MRKKLAFLLFIVTNLLITLSHAQGVSFAVINYDIIGIKLGMTPQQVQKKLSKAGMTVTQPTHLKNNDSNDIPALKAIDKNKATMKVNFTVDTSSTDKRLVASAITYIAPNPQENFKKFKQQALIKYGKAMPHRSTIINYDELLWCTKRMGKLYKCDLKGKNSAALTLINGVYEFPPQIFLQLYTDKYQKQQTTNPVKEQISSRFYRPLDYRHNR